MSQTVGRAIDILELCSVAPRSLRDLAEELNVHRTTILRTVQTLEEAGFVRRNVDGTFGPGFRLAVLARSALDQFDLRNIVHPHIVELSRKLGYTVQFAVPTADRIIYVDKIEPENAITLNTRIGGEVTVNTAGVSKSILAFLPRNRRDPIISAAPFDRFTNRTITDRSEFVQALDDVRAVGWSTDRGEYEDISNCIAAPVWDHSGHVAGAISITSLSHIAGIDALTKHLPILIETTTAISRELGWREHDHTHSDPFSSRTSSSKP